MIVAAVPKVFAKSPGPWSMTATDTAFYLPPTFGNGMTGGVLSIGGLNPSRLFQATVFDDGSDGNVSTLRQIINPFNLTVSVNGNKRIEHWSQTLEMDRATISTHFYIGPVEITAHFRALRQMPHCLMAEIELSSNKPVDVLITNGHSIPSTMTNPTTKSVTIWCEDGGMRMQRSSAAYSNGRYLLAATSMLIGEEGNWRKTGADSLAISLKKGAKASMWAIGSICSQADFADPESEADRQTIYASRLGAEKLKSEHAREWKELWKGDIQIEADSDLPLQVRSALYNLYSSLRADSRRSIAPMGLTSDKYYGHIFWDADTWVFPVLLILQPQLAKAMIDYRIDGLPAARKRAAAYGYRGAMYPWESDHRGEESTPTFALTGPFEHHITADVARAAWQYFCVTADTAWLRDEAYPLLRDCADFWVSRSEKDPRGGRTIANVVGADEYAIGVNNDAFTNSVARKALEHADKAARVLGVAPKTEWMQTARELRLEKMEDNSEIIRLHDAYNGETTKQADVELLAYPLEILTEPQQIKANIDYYAERIDSVGGPAMSHSAMAVNYIRMGNFETARQLIERALRPYLRGPYQLIAETPSNNETYFMTGAGGLLQAILFGYGGYAITDIGLQKYPLRLPKSSGIKSITISTNR